MHSGDIRVSEWMSRDDINSTFVVCFTRLEATSGYPNACRGIHRFNICIMFYKRWGDIRESGWMPRDGINSICALYFTRIEATSGYPDGCRGMVEIQHLYGFHTHWSDIRVSEWMPWDGINSTFVVCFTRIEATSGDKFNSCVMFHTHWGDIRVSGWMPREGIHSTFVLCFGRIEATSGYPDECRGMV